MLSAEQSLTLRAAGTSAHQGPAHLLPHSHRTHLPEADVKALGRCAGKSRAPRCSGHSSQTRARPTTLHSQDQPLQLSTMLEGRGLRTADSVPKAYKECPTAHSGRQREGEYLGNAAKPAGSPAAMPAYLAGVCVPMHSGRESLGNPPGRAVVDNHVCVRLCAGRLSVLAPAPSALGPGRLTSKDSIPCPPVLSLEISSHGKYQQRLESPAGQGVQSLGSSRCVSLLWAAPTQLYLPSVLVMWQPCAHW